MDLPDGLAHWKAAALQLVADAGKLVKASIHKKKSIEVKSSYADLVTQTDKDVEKQLIEGLKKSFPDHRFIGEESYAAGAKCELTDEPTWIIDPVDGTMNFVHGFPLVAISVGLAYKKEIIFGVICNPVLNMTYYAVKGLGAFDEKGNRLKVSDVTEMEKALVAMETGSNRSPEVVDVVLANFSALAPKVHGLRSLGSAALNMCAVADGSVDCYFEYTIHCWDIAAGKLIVEEAGGIVQDPEGGPLDLMSRRLICGSSKALVDDIGKLLKHIRMPSD